MNIVGNLTITLVATCSLMGCSSYTDQELAAMEQVVTALPNEVEGCTFLGDINSNYGSFTINGARNVLKLKTAQLGGNHLVETNLAVRAGYMFPPSNWDSPWMDQDEFYMTGRAYYCPAGKGVTVEKRASLVKDGSQQLQERNGFANKPYQDDANKPNNLDDQGAAKYSLKLNNQVELPSGPYQDHQSQVETPNQMQGQLQPQSNSKGQP